jgi:trimeric autotransporter adhesin
MTGDGLQADLDELANLAGRLRTLMVGGGGTPSSGQTWQATAAATNGVQASVDAASAALGNRIADTASGVDGAAGELAKNEGISADMVSSVGDVATKPGADLAGALSGTVGDITGAFTSAVAGVTGDLASAIAAPLGSLAGALDFAALADVTNGDNGGIFDGLLGDDGGEQLAVQDSPASDNGGNPESGSPETGQVI